MLSTREIKERIKAIPPLSESVRSAMDLLNGKEEEINFMALTQVLSTNPALMSKILAIANSPFYGMSGQINTLAQANIVLGIRSLRSIVTAAGLINQLPPKKNDLMDIQAEWAHGLGTAIAAAAIAELKGLDRELCFTAGLLHDLGIFILVIYFTEEYRLVIDQMQSQSVTLEQAEQKVLNTDHCEVGSIVAKHWRLPKAIRFCIAKHHKPDDIPSYDLNDVVHIGNILSRGLQLGGSGNIPVSTINPMSLKKLKLTVDDMAGLFGDIEKNFQASLSLVSNC